MKNEILKPKNSTIINSELLTDVHNSIVYIRNIPVITDADVAALYEVETKRINEAVKNNPDKFPSDYMFSITLDELSDLRSKNSTTKISTKSRTLPKVFTEKGLYMLATILKSKKALNVTFAIIETFTKVRNLKKELVELHKETDPDKQTSKMQHFGQVLSDIVMPDLETSETESTLELNFFIGKIKHTVKRIKKSNTTKNTKEE
ncbi:MAG: ORF6N domain-containing protein [Paludibacteraceae bacterium]|nr:ORF6N domain-containing protein [Paludibacteraceae bacterium]